MQTTRKSYKCPLFGNIEDLRDNVLPSYENAMKYYEWTRFHLKIKKNSNKEPFFSEIAEIVSMRIENIWKKASLPTVSHTRVLQLLKTYHSKCKNFIKSHKRLSDNKRNDIIQQGKLLFDICSCKCKDFQQCKCPRERKVPKEEQGFLMDQRSQRKMMIGGIDRVTTIKLKKKRSRKIQSEIFLSSEISKKNVVTASQNLMSNSSDSDDCADNPNIPSTSQANENKSRKKRKKSMKKFPALAKTCDRYGVSDRAAAAIASAVLHDVRSDIGVIDKSKLRREGEKRLVMNLWRNRRVSIFLLCILMGERTELLKLYKKVPRNTDK